MPEFVLTEDEDWYFALSNRDSIETTKVVELNLNLFFKPPPHSVKIVDPVDGAQLQIGDIIAISGIVTNETELSNLEISTDGGSSWTSIGLAGNEWTYFWNTAPLNLGTYTIEVKAVFGATQASDAIDVELVDLEPPDVAIFQPSDYSVFNIGQDISISGTATDDIMVRTLELSTDGGSTWTDILLGLSGGYWSYTWHTAGTNPGNYIIEVKASDGYNFKLDSMYIELQDMEAPLVSITSPIHGSKLNSGEIIELSGEASDNRGITRLSLSTDGGGTWVDIISSLNNTQWSHKWDTSGVPLGLYTIVINGSDGIYNSSYTMDIELADLEEPDVSITYPENGDKISLGSTVIIHGKAEDNHEITELLLNTKGGTWTDILPSLTNGQWSYRWDTIDYALGTVTIKLKASDGIYQQSDSITVELVDLDRPEVAISSPSQGEDINCGDIVIVTGTATDNIALTELSISTDSGLTWVNILSDLSNDQWSYQWDTAGLPGGVFTIRVAAADGVNEPMIADVSIDLTDLEMPVLIITSPGANTEYQAGATIPILGTASDNMDISELEISTDNGQTWIAIHSSLRNGRWQYEWDTENLEGGTYAIRVKASDGTYEIEESVVLTLTGGVEAEEELFSLPLILLLVVLFAVFIIAAVSVLLIKRKRKKNDFFWVEELK